MGLFSKADDETTGSTVPSHPVHRYLMLDEQDFACLVRGGVIHVDNLRIALRDIGYIQMDIAIANAEAGIDIHKDHIKER